MRLPTLQQLSDAGKHINKLDFDHSWIALEYIIITIINEVNCVPKDRVQLDEGFFKQLASRAWRTNFVNAFFDLGSFSRRWRGIMQYIVARLSTAYLTEEQARHKAEIIDTLENAIKLPQLRATAAKLLANQPKEYDEESNGDYREPSVDPRCPDSAFDNDDSADERETAASHPHSPPLRNQVVDSLADALSKNLTLTNHKKSSERSTASPASASGRMESCSIVAAGVSEQGAATSSTTQQLTASSAARAHTDPIERRAKKRDSSHKTPTPPHDYTSNANVATDEVSETGASPARTAHVAAAESVALHPSI
jgi:hypothetical protein